MTRTRLAVLGSPIAHSLSPILHGAAYGVLGLDWEYEAIELVGTELAAFVASRDTTWRGLSLTMPLKRDILTLLSTQSELVNESGSANTVLFDRGQLHGYNTDVYGITEAFARHGRRTLGTVLILGAGATAASALVAARQLGVTKAFLGVRSPPRATELAKLGRSQGIDVMVRTLEHLIELDEPLDAVISTVPNGAAVEVRLDADVVREAALFDVAYSPWPTPLAASWPGDEVIGGLEMLVLQALAQVRIFVDRDLHGILDGEPEVLAAMLASVGL
ncbi:MAG TPA: shikimate dehydrogenase [Galbitalea sp.]|jgi:shikimate dehydrogenase|nr:shikimate dehydrogenase [Galbitalea sp.]